MVINGNIRSDNIYTKKQQLRNSRPRGRIKSKRSLATDITKELRQTILVRENGRCAICGNMHWLECHHILEKSRGGMAVEKNLIMLCKEHHIGIHNGNKKIKEYVNKYMKDLYGEIDIKEIKYDKFKRSDKIE